MTNAARYCWRAVGGLVCAAFVAAGLGAWRFLRDPIPDMLASPHANTYGPRALVTDARVARWTHLSWWQAWGGC